MDNAGLNAERRRLREDAQRLKNWQRWGPYLSERQWGTVREDYSADGNPWTDFPHDHARSRAYRWGEDGLLGICDRQARLCFALALWNGRDPILKERLYGLTGPEGNHGEDVKEYYFYQEATPTFSFGRALYKYPQTRFPYAQLVQKNQELGRMHPEFELMDTGIFDTGRYFDVSATHAKASPSDLLIRLTVINRGPDAARLDLLPTLWFRNTWAWGRDGEGYWPRPNLKQMAPDRVTAEHAALGRFYLAFTPGTGGKAPAPLFTHNETNADLLFQTSNTTPYVKDAFHRHVIQNEAGAVSPDAQGTKMALWYRLDLPAGGRQQVDLRLFAEEETPPTPFGEGFNAMLRQRQDEADIFFNDLIPATADEEMRRIIRQGYAGLVWSKQYYHYVVRDWLDGDPSQPPPPLSRRAIRNTEWHHLYNRDVISMPDKWEYPWYAAWDLAFHMIPFAVLDPEFAKNQLILMLREWYMHPNGQIPAYEFAFSDVNPPVHAWAAWRVYKMTGPQGKRDHQFLARVFHKLLLNFTWWVNRKDHHGHNVFSGGFLGLDNIGVFDRSKPLPVDGHLEQADGTAWMAFYCATMLSMALELAATDPAYEDTASKFFEHFIAINDAIHTIGGSGLWDEDDGFYYDHLHLDDHLIPLKIRSMVGLLPLIAVEVIPEAIIARLPGFQGRMNWFLKYREDLKQSSTCMVEQERNLGHRHRLLAIPSAARLRRILDYLLDENEFLAPYGIRSLSKIHAENPYVFHAQGQAHEVRYVPGESNTADFGGNSNWRGPLWFPVNYLIIEALERYHHFYGDHFRVEYPTGSGRQLNLKQIAQRISQRLIRLFLPDLHGRRPIHGDSALFATDPHWRDHVLFYEYFHGETGQGLGASHQTGWTALVVKLMTKVLQNKSAAGIR